MIKYYKCKQCGKEGQYVFRGRKKEFCGRPCRSLWHYYEDKKKGKTKKKEQKREEKRAEINGCVIEAAMGRCQEFLDGSCKGKECLTFAAKNNWPGWEKINNAS